MVNISHSDTIAYDVIPHSEHSTLDLRIAFLETYAGNVRRGEILIQVRDVEIVIVVACSRHDIGVPVRDANELIAKSVHGVRLGIAVVPGKHQHIVHFHGCFAFCMGQSAPQHSLLSVALNGVNQMIRETAKQFHNLLLFVAVFIRTDMDARAGEDGGRATQIFSIQAVNERDYFGIRELQMIHPELLAAQAGAIAGEGKTMSRSIDFRNNLNALCSSVENELAKLILGVAAIFCREPREDLAF